MKYHLLFLFLLPVLLAAQTDYDRSLPEFSFNELDLAGDMHFLASDYLQGRRTGAKGNEIAAEYIAAKLRAYGYTAIDTANDSYFQAVPLRRVSAPTSAGLRIDEQEFQLGENLLVLRGPAAEASGEVVFANYGWVDEESGHDDYADLDVAGKIVVTRAGIPGEAGMQGVFQGIQRKAEMAASAGAVGIFEIYSLPFPWAGFRNYVGGERIGVDNGNPPATIPYGFVRADDELLGQLTEGEMSGSVTSTGMRTEDLASRNVGGILRGSDPSVADEYLLITAHFDHVGVGAQGGGAYTAEDSIFNGARDNAFGTISMLAAARAFAETPPRRSVIILGVTGEEVGLLGSQYFAENPLVPLDQIVFNFNTDGAGYDATDAVSLIGANRTGIDPQVAAAAEAFGKRVIEDPAPEQGLFDRSDNVSFAARGIPALTFSGGTTGFSDEIMRYYHQVTDNPETIDMAYLKEYCQTFTLAARLIANRDTVPFWVEGDKYESAGKELYGIGN